MPIAARPNLDHEDHDHPLDVHPQHEAPAIPAAQFRERLMSNMAETACNIATACDIIEMVRSGEAHALDSAHDKAAQVAHNFAAGAVAIRKLVREARKQEAARDRAVGIRPVPASVREQRDAAVDVAMKRIFAQPLVSLGQGDYTKNYTGAPDPVAAPATPECPSTARVV